jgi:DNA-binding LacI/PurR family transcriptional regulator
MTSQRKKIPAHLIIRQHLLERIKELPPNARLPTEVALAEQFGVSRLTAHKTVMRLQQEGIVVRRGKGGTFVAREAHRVQREGCRGRNGKLAIAYPNWFSYDFWLKVDIAERLALQHGMTPVPIKLNPDTPIGDIAEMVRTVNAKGLLLIAPGGAVERGEVRTLEGLGCPCVLLQPNSHVHAGKNVFAVAPDYRRIGQLQVELLASHGHRRIAYVREEPWSLAGELQLDGMRAAARRLRLPAAAILTPIERTRPWGDTAEAGYVRTRALLARDKPPTALVYDALSGAHAGMRVLHELGLRLPADVSVLTSAPDHPYARYDWPLIGGVAAPPGVLVERAVELVLHPEASPRAWIEPVVAPRESVAPPA